MGKLLIVSMPLDNRPAATTIANASNSIFTIDHNRLIGISHQQRAAKIAMVNTMILIASFAHNLSIVVTHIS